VKEIELIDAYCQFLQAKGYEFKRELRRGSYYSEGFIDIVIKHKTLFMLTAVEAKIVGFKQVLMQALGNSVFFHYSFILYPRIPRGSLDRMRKYGIGLIIPQDQSFKCVVKAKLNVRRWSARIDRNWYQNRVGRVLHTREIPANYENELPLPNYNWTKLDTVRDKCPFCHLRYCVSQINETTQICTHCNQKWQIGTVFPKVVKAIIPKEKKVQYHALF
jgi:hypothetical protein